MTQPQLALIVEDSPTHRMMLKSILEKLDIKTLEAEDGQQAAEIFSQHPIDIVFMDIMMPVMDGYASIREIRLSEDGSGKSAPIVLITSVDNDLELEFAMASGANYAINKPFTADSIHQVLKDIQAA